MAIFNNDHRLLFLEQVKQIVQLFDTPKLRPICAAVVGPDEFIYQLVDVNGKQYMLWGRDYMNELKYEAGGLKSNFDITVRQWIPLKDAKMMSLLMNSEYVIGMAFGMPWVGRIGVRN